MDPEGCHWCRVLGAGPSTIFEDPMFVVLARRGGLDRGRHLTVVPTVHVTRLAEMSSEDMASFLAGLSKLIRWLKEANGAHDVRIRAGRGRTVRDGGSHHFYLNVRTR